MLPSILIFFFHMEHFETFLTVANPLLLNFSSVLVFVIPPFTGFLPATLATPQSLLTVPPLPDICGVQGSILGFVFSPLLFILLSFFPSILFPRWSYPILSLLNIIYMLMLPNIYGHPCLPPWAPGLCTQLLVGLECLSISHMTIQNSSFLYCLHFHVLPDSIFLISLNHIHLLRNYPWFFPLFPCLHIQSVSNSY